MSSATLDTEQVSEELRAFAKTHHLSDATIRCLISHEFLELSDIECLRAEDVSDLGISMAQKCRLRNALDTLRSGSAETTTELGPRQDQTGSAVDTRPDTRRRSSGALYDATAIPEQPAVIPIKQVTDPASSTGPKLPTAPKPIFASESYKKLLRSRKESMLPPPSQTYLPPQLSSVDDPGQDTPRPGSSTFRDHHQQQPPNVTPNDTANDLPLDPPPPPPSDLPPPLPRRPSSSSSENPDNRRPSDTAQLFAYVQDEPTATTGQHQLESRPDQQRTPNQIPLPGMCRELRDSGFSEKSSSYTDSMISESQYMEPATVRKQSFTRPRIPSPVFQPQENVYDQPDKVIESPRPSAVSPTSPEVFSHDQQNPIIGHYGFRMVSLDEVRNLRPVTHYDNAYFSTFTASYSLGVQLFKPSRQSNVEHLVNALNHLLYLKHENILSVFGVMVDGTLPVMVVSGVTCLHDVIKAPQTTSTVQVRYGLDVARGLEYIHSQGLVMCDGPTARTCWVDGERAVVGGFSLAHDVSAEVSPSLYQAASLPSAWMAPEWIKSTNFKFTQESDMWTYGVCLWEILSGGREPYHDLPDDSLILAAVNDGYRMDSPEGCPSDVASVLTKCWQEEPRKRLTVTQVCDKLRKVLRGLESKANTLTGKRRGSSGKRK